jgi:DNA-binding transcriptional LysR family regulator
LKDRRLRRLHSAAFDYFVAVVQEGSFRSAARRLGVAASAINRHILLLEIELGFVLFDRKARGLKLNEAGEILYRHCTTTARSFEDALEQLDALRELRRGVVRVAASESFAAEIVPEICADFNDIYPGIRLNVIVAGTDTVVASVASDESDVGFAFGNTAPPGVRIVSAVDLPIGAVVGAKHPLARRKKVSLRDCLKYPLLIPDSRLSFRRRIDEISDIFSSRQTPGIEATSPRLMIGIARMNRHVTFQTYIGITDDLARGTFVFLPLTDKKLKPDHCMIIASARSRGRFAAERFCSFASEALSRKLGSVAT